MKITVEGFRQDLLVEYGLDCVDACLLRYIVDFFNSDKMTKIENEGKQYFWLKYQAVIEGLPIIGIKNRDSLSRRMKKMCDAGILERYIKKENGSYSCYRFTEKYTTLLEKFTEHTTQKSGGDDSKVDTLSTQKSGQKISLLNKTSLLKDKKDRNVFKPPMLEEVEALVREKGYTFKPMDFINYYEALDWKDSYGNKIRNWKGKMYRWQENQRPTSPTNAFKEMPVAK